MTKKIIILADPNGAGKTTFAKSFLPNEAACITFINAYLIAAGIAAFAPESAAITAGRLMLKMIQIQVVSDNSFALETTLSGMGCARMASQCDSTVARFGLHRGIIFLSLPSVE